MIRYIRDWLRRINMNYNSRWVEIKAFDENGNNIAYNKPVTSNTSLINGRAVTDGKIDTLNYQDVGNCYFAYVQIDLGDLYNIEKIIVWHYYRDSRIYPYTKLEVSADGEIWYTLYDSDRDGTYSETSAGKIHFVIINYKVNISINGNGSVTGAGTYNYEDSVTIQQIPADHWKFVGWTGDITGTESSKTFIITKDMNIQQNFVANTHEIDIAIIGQGTVTGTGTYDYGSMVTITQTPETGYHFVEWSGDITGTEPIKTFTVTRDMNIVQNFQINTYIVNITTNGQGTVIGAGTYNHGELVTVTQTPQDNYRFVNWSGDLSGTTPTKTFTITKNMNIVQNFQLNQYIVNIAINGNGTVSGSGTYIHGESVTISQTPDIGYHFVNWTGDITGTELTKTFTITKNMNIVQNFQINTYTVNITKNGQGSISGVGTYNHGQTVTVKQTPANGYSFVNWTGDLTGIETTKTFILTSNINATQNFQINTYQINITVNGNGSVDGSGSYTYGQSATIKQTPDIGYHFVNWTGDITGTDPIKTFTVTRDMNIVQNFQINTYTITIVENNNGTEIGSGTYTHGDLVTIEQFPNEGYHFVEWYYSNNQNDYQFLSNQNSYTFIATSNLQIFPKYEINKYLVTFEIEGNGSIDRQNEYINHGDLLRTINYFPDPGWKFSTWKINGIETDILPTIVTEKLTITQVFEKEIYQLTINIIGQGTTNIISGQYEYGDTIEIIQTPNNHWEFKNWTGDIVSNNNPLLLTINKDMIINQNFIIKQYNFTFEIVGNGRINVQQGKYQALTNLNITQTPDISSIFKIYTGQIVSNNPNITLLMDSDKHLVVVFELKKFSITYEIIGNATATLIPNQDQFDYGSNQKIQIIPEQGWVVTKIEER